MRRRRDLLSEDKFTGHFLATIVLAIIAGIAIGILASCSGGGSSHPRKMPATQPAGVTINVDNVADLFKWTLYAYTHPRTTIVASAGNYPMLIELPIRGDGTRIVGAGASTRFIILHHNDGLIGTGRCFMIAPEKGTPAPFDIHSTGIWENPPQNCRKLSMALIGIPDVFNEAAPAQYADGKPLAGYTYSTPIITPAQNITLENFTIVGNPQGMAGLYAFNTKNLTLKNITVEGGPDSARGVNVVTSQNARIEKIKGYYVFINSTNSSTITDCDVDEVDLEEMCRWNVVEKNRTRFIRIADILCDKNQIINNIITRCMADHSSISIMGVNTLVSGNTCDNYIFMQGFADKTTITNNTALSRRNFTAKGAFTESGNTWTEK